MSSEGFVFQKLEDGLYERKCFGFEAVGNRLSDKDPGTSLCVLSASVVFAAAMSKTEIQNHIYSSLITLRMKLPGIACTLRKLDSSSEYTFKYEIPRSYDHALSWARTITVFQEYNLPFFEEHNSLKEDNLWRASDGRYTLELHASASSSGWNFSILSLHCNIDARSSAIFMDYFLQYLASSIKGSLEDPRSIIWGEEYFRLPAPGPFSYELAKSGLVPILPDVADIALPPTPKNFIPWILPPLNYEVECGDICRRVKLSKEITNKLHTVSKSRGYSMTQVISAILSLAFTESIFLSAAELGEDRFISTYKSFIESTHYLIPMNFADKRSRLPEGFNSFDTGKPAPYFAIDSFDIAFPISSIRDLLRVEKQSKRIYHATNQDVFWNELVAEIAEAWKRVDTSDYCYLKRQLALNLMGTAEQFDTSAFEVVTPFISSIGDFGRLGILNDFLPSTEAKAFTVDDVIFSMRSTLPTFLSYAYEYDGQLQVVFFSGCRYTHKNMVDYYSKSLQKWIDEII